MLWQGDEPEGGTKPFGSMTEKGLLFFLFLSLVFFLFWFILSWLFKKNGLVFLLYKTWYSFTAAPTEGEFLGLVSSWHGEEQAKEMNKRKKKMKVQKFFKVWL